MSADMLELLLEHLSAAGIDMRENGRGRWRGNCPACGGSDRLVVNRDLNLRVWVKCWSATCEPDDVLSTLNLSSADLRDEEKPGTWKAPGFETVSVERVDFLVPERVPLGAVTLLAGDPGEGKSTLACLWAAQLSNGALGEPGVVLFASAEDGVANVLKPRAVAAGATVERIRYFEIRKDGYARGLVLPDDHELLADAVDTLGVRFVVIDPLNAHLGGSIDSWKDHGIRSALAPLARLADEHSCAIVCVCHLNKSKGGNPLYRIGGSVGYVGAARSVLGFGRDPDEDDHSSRRLLGHVKANWATRAPTQAYELEQATVIENEIVIDTSRLVHIEDLDDVPADVVFGGKALDDRGADVEEAITEQLASGPRKSREVKTDVAAELGVSTRTVERGGSRMNRRGDLTVTEGGFPRTTIWELGRRDDGRDGAVPDSGDSSHDRPFSHRVVTVAPLEQTALESQISQSRHSHDTEQCGDVATGEATAPTTASTVFFDSVELRLLAAYAPGGALARAFAEGSDLHQQTADLVGVSREEGKRLNYLNIYGGGASLVMDTLGCTMREAEACSRASGWHIARSAGSSARSRTG